MSYSKRQSRQYWEGLVQLQRESGQTIKIFCKANQLNCHTFQYWRSKLKREKSVVEVKGFVALKTQVPSNAKLRLRWKNDLEIDLPGGYPVEALADLLKALVC